MTFKHISFSDSPVMRELERLAKAKGEVNSPAPVESIVKKAAASKKKVSYEPSEDLMQDILKLADGLRAKGFEKQADSLETKFLNYKKAETHLYRAIDEDGEDVIDFAHPHAAKPISDSEHAKVPNILERHKKIVDVVNKQPTGKYAAADVVDIVKDAANILGIKFAANDVVIKNLKIVLRSINNISDLYNSVGLLTKYGDLTSMIEKTQALAKSVINDPDLDELERLRVLIQNLKRKIEPIFGSIGPAVLGLEMGGIDPVIFENMQPYFDRADSAIQKAIAELEKTEETGASSVPNAIIDIADVPMTISREPLKEMAQVIASKLERLAQVAIKDPKTQQIGIKFSSLAGIFRNLQNQPNATYAEAWKLSKNYLEKPETFISIKDLDYWIMRWENYYKQLKLIASDNNGGLKKKAQEPPAIKEAPVTPAVTSPSEHPKAHRPSSAVAVQEPEKGAVQRLQMILNRLGMELASDPKNKEFANILIATGPKGAETIDQFDGKWGPNTDAAVQAATKLGIEGIIPGATYSHKPKSKEDVDAAANKAEKNVNAIVRYMNSKGMGEKIPAILKKKRAYKTLDSIKQGSTLDDTWVSEDDFPGGVPVTTVDLISFMDLDKLIKRAGLQTTKPAQQQAQGPQQAQYKLNEIVDPWAKQPSKQTSEQVGLQQEMKPAKVNLGSFIESVRLLKSAQAVTTGRTKQGWREILQRFGARAIGQYERAKGAEDVDDNIVQTKTLYYNSIQNLTNKLQNGTANLPDDQVISAYDLDYKLQAGGAASSGVAGYTGQTMPGQTMPGQGQMDEGSEFQIQLQKTIDHPLGNIINLWALKRAYGHVMTNIDDYSSKLIQGSYLDIESLNNAPLEFADQFLKPLTLDDVKTQFLNNRKLSQQQRAAIQNMTQNSPTYMMYVGMAKLLRVMDVLTKLRADLSRVPSAIDAVIKNQGTNSGAQRRTSPQAIQEAAIGWANWNGRILEMIQRVNDQYQSLSTGVSRTSRNEPV